ncbi:MAG: hypothetical protein K2U26_08325 [Cyclobacteriaceae bacterium]|nr:hypothetical protein [Cyclobacteriaceae bacterium]
MKKIFFLIAALVMIISISAVGQSKIVVDEIIQTDDNTTKNYLIVKSLILRPTGSSVIVLTPSSSLKLINPDNSAIPPSLDNNFVRTETILAPAITQESQIRSLGVQDKSTVYEYADGIGRKSQDVVAQGSPSKADAVAPYRYDSASRMKFTYPEYSIGSQKGAFRSNALSSGSSYFSSEQYSFYNGTPKVGADMRPYGQTNFELSPIDRVLESYGPGLAWRTNSKKSSASFAPAGTTINQWLISSSSGLPYVAGSYLGDFLSKNTVTTEGGNQIIEYTDFRGLTVRREQDGLVTIYVYNTLGNLMYVLPPQISSISGPTQAQVDAWAFQYVYDNRQRLIRQKDPGIDWVYYVYDNWDRIVATQDGNQRNKTTKEWTFFKYDEFNRPIMTGVLTSANNHTDMINAVSGSHHEVRDGSDKVGYTLGNSFPTPAAFPSVTEANLLVINYYDNYSFLPGQALPVPNWDQEGHSFSFTNPAGFSNTALSPVKGQMTASKTRVMNNSTWLNAVVYYDKKYRVLQAIQEHHLGGVDRATFAYNFVGWTMKSLREHATSVASVSILEENEYDHSGRLLKTWHTLDGGTRTLLASNSYNELGQLVEANLHSTNSGASFLQSVDYRYNIRGWLTHINNSTLTADANNDDTNDLFGMQIVYNDQNPTVNGTAVTSQFNGNIAAIKWKTDNKKYVPKERIYGYGYDAKNRLNKSFYAASNGSTWTDEAAFYDEDNLTYDNNGNLNSLKRNARLAGAAGTLDNLNYNALGTTSVNNQLLTVEDAGDPNLGFVNGSNGQVTEYQFDKNGNMTIDMNNAVTDVKYNYLNLPEKVTINGGTASETSVEFTYDASGYLLRKINKRGSTEESRVDYVNGIQYYNNALAQVFTPAGRATKYNGAWEYEYFMKDHQGNTRLVFGFLHDTDVYKATMESYYASQEEATFKKVAATRASDLIPPGTPPFKYNRTPRSTDVPSPDKAAKLNGSVGGLEVGPGKMLTVSAGDKLKLEVYARYKPGSGTASDVIASLVSAATTSMNVTAAENPAAYNGFNTYLPGFTNSMVYDVSQPKAYLNYILFDANYANAVFGYKVIGIDAATMWEKLALDVSVTNNGYIFIYLTNESNYDVYFDDLQIIHEKNTMSLRVTESADYYPFGLLVEGTRYRDESRLVNSYGYQGEYSEFDARTGWNRFALRGNYDSRIGRWQSGDPYSQYASPYIGMGNNPANRIDPNGGFTLAPVVIWGAKNMAKKMLGVSITLGKAAIANSLGFYLRPWDDVHYNSVTQKTSVIKTGDNFDKLYVDGQYMGRSEQEAWKAYEGDASTYGEYDFDFYNETYGASLRDPKVFDRLYKTAPTEKARAALLAARISNKNPIALYGTLGVAAAPIVAGEIIGAVSAFSGEAVFTNQFFGYQSRLFGRYNSRFLPDGVKGWLNRGPIRTGWSNKGTQHVFRTAIGPPKTRFKIDWFFK